MLSNFINISCNFIFQGLICQLFKNFRSLETTSSGLILRETSFQSCYTWKIWVFTTIILEWFWPQTPLYWRTPSTSFRYKKKLKSGKHLNYKLVDEEKHLSILYLAVRKYKKNIIFLRAEEKKVRFFTSLSWGEIYVCIKNVSFFIQQ